jgi:hypothetical protein
MALFTFWLYHQDRHNALEELHRVLRVGGRLFRDSHMAAQ